MDPFIAQVIEQAAIKYFDLYRINRQLSEYHHLISLVTSQQVKFETGRQIRQQLYQYCYPLDPTTVGQIDLSTINGLTTARIYIIRSITNAALNNNTDLINVAREIVGVGPWTIKGALILTERSHTEALFEDSYICKRLAEIYNFDVDRAVCRAFFRQINENNRSVVSYFLWRIKRSGCMKLRTCDELTRDDFL